MGMFQHETKSKLRLGFQIITGTKTVTLKWSLGSTVDWQKKTAVFIRIELWSTHWLIDTSILSFAVNFAIFVSIVHGKLVRRVQICSRYMAQIFRRWSPRSSTSTVGWWECRSGSRQRLTSRFYLGEYFTHPTTSLTVRPFPGVKGDHAETGDSFDSPEDLLRSAGGKIS